MCNWIDCLLTNGALGITFTFEDANTLLLYNGKKKKLTDEDKITIQYKDKTDVIPIKNLYKDWLLIKSLIKNPVSKQDFSYSTIGPDCWTTTFKKWYR